MLSSRRPQLPGDHGVSNVPGKTQEMVTKGQQGLRQGQAQARRTLLGSSLFAGILGVDVQSQVGEGSRMLTTPCLKRESRMSHTLGDVWPESDSCGISVGTLRADEAFVTAQNLADSFHRARVPLFKCVKHR